MDDEEGEREGCNEDDDDFDDDHPHDHDHALNDSDDDDTCDKDDVAKSRPNNPLGDGVVHD